MTSVFDLSGPLLDGIFAIEASAGTGKTFSLTGLVARHVAERGIAADQLLMVTFTRTAAAEMRDRTRSSCRAYLSVLEADAADRSRLAGETWMLDGVSRDEDENTSRAGHLRSFLATYDEATITTIHGFCQLVLLRAGLRSPALGDVTLVGSAKSTVDQVVGDVLIGPLSEQPDLLDDPTKDSESAVGTTVKNLAEIVSTVLGSPRALRIPALTRADHESEIDDLDVERRWGVIVQQIANLVRERRRTAGVFGYDDLIHSVAELLTGDDGERIVRTLRDQYRLVLIDEFQDTDVDQWTIFDSAFVEGAGDGSESEPTTSFGIVGDPKQAIYRFRGADIDAYRAAVERIDARVDLLTNFRSNSRVIGALNALFEGVTFGDPTISYRRVSARPGDADEGILAHPAVDIRYVPYSVEAGGAKSKTARTKADRLALAEGTLDKWNQNTDQSLELIFADMASSIQDLLSSGTIVDKNGHRKAVEPGHIAVIVRAHKHAERIREVLASVNIPCVRYKSASVFRSPAVLEWRIFLTALAAPSRIDRVRAAALTVFGTSRVGSLLSDTGHEVEQWQRTCAELAADVQQFGLAAVYFRLRSEESFMVRMIGESQGERLLTDLDHIAEVLSNIPDIAQGCAAADCLEALDRLIGESGDEDEYQRRIETDARAVHILTIHHSKGLEFPIVYLPTMTKVVAAAENPHIFSSDGRRVIDVASPVEWSWPDGPFISKQERKSATIADIMGDSMRMLYVALTRAEQKIVLYWSPLRGSAGSVLGRLLFAPRVGAVPEIDSESWVPVQGRVPDSNVEMREWLLEIAARSPDITVSEVQQTSLESRPFDFDLQDDTDIGIAHFARTDPVRRPQWGKWSYSGIASILGTVQTSVADPFLPGADESPGRESVSTRASSPTTAILFPDGLAGAAFGSRIHEILETIDPAGSDLEESIGEEVRRRFARLVDSGTCTALVDALVSVCSTPLGPLFQNRRLSDIDRSDRLAETTFDMRIPDSPVALARLGDVISRHVASTDPLAEYADILRRRADRIRIAGFLYGEIDAVFRLHRVDGSWSAIVADYKTNILHSPGSPDALAMYGRPNLERVMIEDHYMLQALIYQVALHRYLRWRVEDYEPETHLGGFAYLFVRGLVGVDTPLGATGEPAGLFTCRPPVSLIIDLDEELAS